MSVSEEAHSESNKASREDLEYLRMSASELNNFGVNLFELGDAELALKFYKEALQAMMIVIPKNENNENDDDDNKDNIDISIPDMKKRFQTLFVRGNTHAQTRRKRKKKLEWCNPTDIYPLLSGVDCGAMASMTAFKAHIPHKSKRKIRKQKSINPQQTEISSASASASVVDTLETTHPSLKEDSQIIHESDETEIIKTNDDDDDDDDLEDCSVTDNINERKPLTHLGNEIMKMKMNSPLNRSSNDHHSEIESALLSPPRWSPMTCLSFGPLRMSSGLLDVPLGEVELMTRNNISIVVDTPLPKLSGKVRDTFLEVQEWQDRDTNLVCTLTTHRIVFNVAQEDVNTKTAHATKTRQISLSSIKEATSQGSTKLFVNRQCKIRISIINFGNVQIWFNYPPNTMNNINKEDKKQQYRDRDEMLSWLRKSLARKAWNNNVVSSTATSTTDHNHHHEPPPEVFSNLKNPNDVNISSSSLVEDEKQVKQKVKWATSNDGGIMDVSLNSDQENETNNKTGFKDDGEWGLDRWAEMLNEANEINKWMTEIPVRCDCARILYNMGLTYLINNRTSSAQKLFETALSIVRQDEEGFPYGATVFPFCINNIGKLMYDQGDDRALIMLFEALKLARLCLDQHKTQALNQQAVVVKEDTHQYHECLAMVLSNLGRIHFRNQDYIHSLERCREALSERRKAYDGDDHNNAILITFCNIGFIYEKQGSVQEALLIYKALFDYPFTPKNNDIQNEYFDLLLHYLSVRCRISTTNSNSNYSKDLEKIRLKKADSSRDLQQLSGLLYRVATVLSEMNEKNYALPFYLEQLSTDRVLHGRHHPYLVSTLNNIGQTYKSLSLIDIALSYYHEALSVIVDAPGDDDGSHMIGIILHNIGSIHFQKGSNNKAMEVINRAIKLQRENLGDDHPDVAALLQTLGIIQMQLQHQQQQNDGDDNYGVSDEQVDDTKIDENINQNFKAACTKMEYNFGVNRNAQSMYRIGTMSTWYGM